MHFSFLNSLITVNACSRSALVVYLLDGMKTKLRTDSLCANVAGKINIVCRQSINYKADFSTNSVPSRGKVLQINLANHFRDTQGVIKNLSPKHQNALHELVRQFILPSAQHTGGLWYVHLWAIYQFTTLLIRIKVEINCELRSSHPSYNKSVLIFINQLKLLPLAFSFKVWSYTSLFSTFPTLSIFLLYQLGFIWM